MNLPLLIIAALLLPGVWGSLVALFFERVVPSASRDKPSPLLGGPDPYPMNFQI